MWNFSEREIEAYVTGPGSKRGRIEVDDFRYEILATQDRMIWPEHSHPSSQRPLFRELAGLEAFLPTLQGPDRFPDILVRRRFKRGKAKRRKKALAIIELKKENATVADVAQLRRYMNLLAFSLKYDIGQIWERFGVSRKYPVCGVLLAPHIPKDVWMAACSTSAPDIDLIAYDLVEEKRAKEIREINYLDLGNRYAKDLWQIGRKYHAYRKTILEPTVASAESPPNETGSSPQPQTSGIEEAPANRQTGPNASESGETGDPPASRSNAQPGLPFDSPKGTDLPDPCE